MDAIDIVLHGADGNGGLYRWEDPIPYFYLDNHEEDGVPAPLVTTALGCALLLPEALTLPWQINGRPATITEIADDFTTVKNASFGYKASFYEDMTQCRLTADAIEAFARKRIDTFLGTLNQTFPTLTTWPLTCQAGAIDLIYGLGAKKFLSTYPLFIGYGKQTPPNFKGMAAQGGSNTNIAAYNDRNQARKLLFLQGAV